MLQHLSDLQLGLRYDVYAALFYPQKLFMEPAPLVCGSADQMGNHLLQTSGAIFREYQRLSPLPKLHGETMHPQKAAALPLETD